MCPVELYSIWDVNIFLLRHWAKTVYIVYNKKEMWGAMKRTRRKRDKIRGHGNFTDVRKKRKKEYKYRSKEKKKREGCGREVIWKCEWKLGEKKLWEWKREWYVGSIMV